MSQAELKSIMSHMARDVKVGEVLLLSSVQRDEYSAHFHGTFDNLCKGKLLCRFGDLEMEVTGLCSTPKAEHKDCKIQPQSKNTSVTSR